MEQPTSVEPYGAPGWDTCRAQADGGAFTDEGRRAVRWAIDLLETTLGRSWPKRQVERYGRLPRPLLSYAIGRGDLYNLLKLACQIDRFGGTPGFRDALVNVRRYAADAEWWHFELQLEIARVGVDLGATVAFEPAIPDTDRALDVELTFDGVSTGVEAVTLSRADSHRAQERIEHTLWRELDGMAVEQGVAVDVTLNVPLDEVRQRAIVSDFRGLAAFVSRNAIPTTSSRNGAKVTVTSADHESGVGSGVTSLVGAVHQRDGWLRLQKSLNDKVRQTQGASGVRLRADAFDGLFAFTDWIRKPLDERIQIIADTIRWALQNAPHVDGVVLSSGLGATGTGTPDPAWSQQAEYNGAVFVIRPVGKWLVRQTVVVPTHESGLPVADRWVRAYGNEDAWLAHDLAEHGWRMSEMFVS